jgi:Cys-rich protein (TIGR01571 family)
MVVTGAHGMSLCVFASFYQQNSIDMQHFDAVEKTPMVEEMPAAAVTIAAPVASVPWQTGLFSCFEDWRSCVDGAVCNYCQNARQYNMMNHGVNDIHAGACLGQLSANLAAAALLTFLSHGHGQSCNVGTLAMIWMNRRQARERYNIAGSDCGDAAAVLCCSSCSTCQVYREMSVRNEWPSGFAVSAPFAMPPAPQMMGEVVTQA